MKPETPAADPKPVASHPSLKARLMGEAMIEAGEKNNEPSMVKAGKKLLGL